MLRTGVNYHINSKWIVSLLYGYFDSQSFQEENRRSSSEHRLHEQLIYRHKIGNFILEGRIWVENRWISSGGQSVFENRLRLRPQLLYSFNPKWQVQGNTEWFFNLQNEFYNQLWLYGGLVYILAPELRLQFGWLHQQISDVGLDRLVFGMIFHLPSKKQEAKAN